MSTVLVTLNALATHASFREMSIRQAAVLGACYSRPSTELPHTVRGLAAELKINRPAVTRAMDALTKSKLAERKPDPKDGRSVFLVITKSGRKAIDHLTRTITLGK